MFDIFAHLLSSIITILFPIFASYKALGTSDPAQLTPWLMYWVVLCSFLLVESWTDWILVWVPFYPYLRLFTLSYLVAPQTQGARIIYQTHVHPFLAQHEHEIDDFISSAHDRAKAAGLQYLKQAIELIKEHVFGLPPKAPATPPPPTSAYPGSYAQSLFARFNLPAAREGAPAGDFYSLLTTALATATSGLSRDAQPNDLSASGTLIPPSIKSPEERLSYIATQRERLRVLMQAFDKEATSLSQSTPPPTTAVPSELALEAQPQTVPGALELDAGMEALKKSRSELDFEKVDFAEETADNAKAAAASGGWMPWNWAAAKPAEKQEGKKDPATASGVEL